MEGGTRNTVATVLVVVLGLVGGAPVAGIDDSARPFIEWAREHAQPIETTRPGHGFEDLQGLRDIVGDARVVAIGESEHYIGEFFEMKHRFVEFLVEEMGFTAVAFESGFADAAVLHDYVLGGPAVNHMWDEGLTAGHAVFQETRDMVEWMRAYNADPEHRHEIQLFGAEYLGFNGTWMPAMEPVLRFLDRVDPGSAAVVRESLLPLIRKFDRRSDPETDDAFHSGRNHLLHHVAYLDELTAADRQALTAETARLVYRFELYRHVYTDASSPENFEWAFRLARTLQQADRFYFFRPEANGGWEKLAPFDRKAMMNIRAEVVRDNVGWMLDRGHKVILLVHNLHAMRSGDMGTALSRMLGDDYVSIGSTYRQGTTITEGLTADFAAVEQPPATHEGIDGVLAEVGPPMFLLDLGQVPDEGAVHDWLSRPRKMRAIGGYFGDGIPLEDWDALYFIRDISIGEVADQSDRGTPVSPDPGEPG